MADAFAIRYSHDNCNKGVIVIKYSCFSTETCLFCSQTQPARNNKQRFLPKAKQEMSKYLLWGLSTALHVVVGPTVVVVRTKCVISYFLQSK